MRHLTLFVVFILVAPAFASDLGPPMPPPESLPGDRAQQHEETVSKSPGQYHVKLDAAVDGVMTRTPVGYKPFAQGWQPNRFARIENIGDTDVIDPWISVNGKGRWRTAAEIAAQATAGRTEPADKARAIWEFTRQHRFHATTWDAECQDAVKAFNCYGYTLCGDDAMVLADLWKAAGFTTRRGFPVGHCVSEVLYDGGFHLLDGDEHGLYLRRDNQTVASEEDVVRDHDLIKRTHVYSLLNADSRKTDESSASLFGYEGPRSGELGGKSGHTLAFTLRPGEALEWRWDHTGKQYTAGTRSPDGQWHTDGEGDLGVWGPDAYAALRNGRLYYAPNLLHPIARRGLVEADNLAAPDPLGFHPAVTQKPARAVWKMASPYVIVGAKVTAHLQRATAADLVKFSFSADGRTWAPLPDAAQAGACTQELVLDDKLSLPGHPDYQYFLRVEMTAAGQAADAALASLSFQTDVQMAALALPELEAGRNTIAYTDQSPGARKVRILQAWVERQGWHPPAAPLLATPAAGAAVAGTQARFTWTPAAHPDGEPIPDYQIQVSAYPDLRWTVSPNFDKLLSKTAWRGQTEWTAPYAGLLNPGVPYYWRVRAQDRRGVWGPWSKTGSFRCEGPGVPLRLQVLADASAGTVRLSWEDNPDGSVPKEFSVYASNEKGFTASDSEYEVLMGRGFCRTLNEYNQRKDMPELIKTPSNVFTTTSAHEALVVGPRLPQTSANRCFYRVAAVDAHGVRSGPSDYARRRGLSSTPLRRAAPALGNSLRTSPTVCGLPAICAARTLTMRHSGTGNPIPLPWSKARPGCNSKPARIA